MSESISAQVRKTDGFKLPRWLRSLDYIFLFVFLAGAILIVVGLFMPPYSDPIAIEKIRSGLECEIGVPNLKSGEMPPCESDVWHRSMDGLRTHKWRLIDFGGGLMASAITLFGFVKWHARQSRSMVCTPKRSVTIVALASIVWLMQVPAHSLYYFVEFSRDCCPWWADSLSIPIVDTAQGVLVLLLPWIGLWLVFVAGARLPAPVFLTVPGRPLVNFIWTGAAALLFVPIVINLLIAIIDGPVTMVPFLWFALWLVLCARAAALSRHLSTAKVLQA